jgi:hypothetical protein
VPFAFRRAYALTIPSENYIPGFEAIAVGVRVLDDQPLYGTDGGPAIGRCTEVLFLLNDDSCGHHVLGRVAFDDGDAIEVEDLQRHGNDGSSVYWRFEPLTRDMVLDMADLQGRIEIVNECRTDEAIQAWFLAEFLGDWWRDFPPEDESVRGARAR